MTYIAQTRPAHLSGRTTPKIAALYGLWKQRRQLRQLDARTLSDIGVSRQEAQSEARRPFWDVPAHWLR